MSGILGAIAIVSVSARRQAEGGGGAAGELARSAGFLGGASGLAAVGSSGSTAGASSGRGFGNGIFAE